MITQNLPLLKIHKLTEEQYRRELDAGRVDPSALYLTPDDTEYATKEYVDNLIQQVENSLQAILQAQQEALAKLTANQ